MTDETVAREMTKGLMELAENIKPLLEAVEGYRLEVERHGYGEAQARKMAADYHAALLRMVFK